MKPSCSDQLRLLSAYREASDAYTHAVIALSMPTVTSDYEMLVEKAAAARKQCLAARLALAEHQKEHGC